MMTNKSKLVGALDAYTTAKILRIFASDNKAHK